MKFNDAGKLGKGKDMMDRPSNLLDADRIKLTHHDSQSDGKHHFLPISAAPITEFVTLSMTKADAGLQ